MVEKIGLASAIGLLDCPVRGIAKPQSRKVCYL